MFKNAIVRLPATTMIEGLTSANLGKPDYAKACDQHSLYSDLLRRFNLKVEVLPENDLYPDSTFVEDVALCTEKCAVITCPGAVSRRGETEGMSIVLSKYFDNIEYITLPGTIEAGDIMKVGNHYYIGLSERTNNNGAEQMINILNKHGMTGSKVPLKKTLHLKSGVSYLENNTMFVCGEFADNEAFKKYNRIEVDSSESYAANSLWINGKVIVPQGFPATRDKIESIGYETFTLDVSEFCKLDGGLSCLSLRF
jgi:dimethylargininase